MRTSLSTMTCVMGLLALLTACETTANHKAKEDSPVSKQAASEVSRICALHGQERAAEVKKLRESTGMELFCPND